MGRDWYWGSGGGGGGGPKTSSSINTTNYKRDSGPTTPPTPTGCIGAVFHLFDFQFSLNNQTSSSSSCSCFKPHSFLTPAGPTDTTPIPKGAEAPRNSLESEDASTSASASIFTSTSKEEEILNIPMGMIQIKTSSRDTRSTVGAPTPNNETCSEISCSSPGSGGGAKTPTLVARLMGLDLLPETRSPSFSSSSNLMKPNLQGKNIIAGHRKSLDGTRSLPETPRRKSDVDHHHRLSLQINRDNMSSCEEMVISRLSSTLKRKDVNLKHHDHQQENRSTGHYASRQIVKQVKQSLSRKVGMDITNTVRNREHAREELVSQFKYKKPLTKVASDESSRLRFLESKSKPAVVQNHDPAEPPKSSLSSTLTPEIQKESKLQPVEEEEQDEQQKMARAASKCKKGCSEKFGSSRLKKPQQTSDIIRNKQEEPFVRPSTANYRVNVNPDKCRKTPLSNSLLNIITVPTLVPVKKEASSPATKIPQKQVLDAQRPKRSSQLSSCSSQTYNKQETTQIHVARDNNNGDRCKDAATSSSTATTTGGDIEAEYFEYIARILKRTGLDKDTPVCFCTSWFSPAHPLDPSIFYYLEHFSATSSNKTNSRQLLSHRCNRKLLFHLVDEILAEILKPYFNMKPWVVIPVGRDYDFISHMMDGCQLIDTLCSKIRSFPQADCRVLEDIDALIDKDLREMKLQSLIAYEEEGEGIVKEIEKDILEALLHETAVDFGVRVSTY